MFSVDCGTITHYAARVLQIKQGQSFTGTGTLVSMAAGLPTAIAAAFAHPDRTSIGIAGDGGFAMLMSELSTAVVHNLNLKMLVLNNDALGEVISEQKEMGFQEYGCRLGHMDFAAFANSVGAKGYKVSNLSELESTMQAWLAESGPALLDVQTDPEEAPKEPWDLKSLTAIDLTRAVAWHEPVRYALPHCALVHPCD